LPKVSSDQRTASAFKGSPTLARWRSEERSCRRASSFPSRINRRIAVGAEYQTVALCRSRNWYQRAALKPESRTSWVTPHAHGPMIP
jgi:hypothetical protein